MNDMSMRFGSGHAVRRIEDPTLVSGSGRFVDDVNLPGQLHLVFLRSPHAHARILSIDARAALAVPGVKAVLTGADLVAAGVRPIAGVAGFVRADGSPAASADRHAIAHERVRFVGEAVAAIVADSRDAARDARDAVLVDYEDLPAVADPRAAVQPGAPVLCEAAPDNVSAEVRHGNAEAAAEGFARAAHVVSVDIVNQRLAPAPMEPRGVLAAMEDGRLIVRLSSQMPTAVRGGLAASLGLPETAIRVLVGDVGGGFGMKTGIYPEDVAVAHAARALNVPVKWTADRGDEFQSAVAGRDVISHAEMALDADGRVLGLRVDSIANVGAYASGVGVAIQLLIGPWVSTSIYDITAFDFHAKAVMTHTTPTGAYRGAGRPEAIYLIERLMDAAARELGMDPAELRRRNLIQPSQMPYRNAMGQTYDTGDFPLILSRGLELADWNGFAAREAASKAKGKLRGLGLASFLEWTGGNAFEEKVTVTVAADGYIEIVSATQAMGQGIATSYAQLAVDVFGVPLEKIRIVQGDTDRAVGFGSAGSRSLFTGGSAVEGGARRTVETAKELAADALECAPADVEYRAGEFRIMGTDRAVGLFELAGRQPQREIVVNDTTTVAGPTWPNACHVCEVEIDPATGGVEVVSYSSVNDIGRVVNPTIVRGQIEGGAVQGIGQALTEHLVYDESGQLLTGSFMDYAMPRADLARHFRTEFDESVPSTNNPLGVKGVGELGTIGGTPAVVNAVVDALARAGLGREAEKIQMPVTGERVWSMLRQARG